MKVLSGRQPWWWAILHAGKRIENRVMVVKGQRRPPTWHRYRGPILLHAAEGCTAVEHEQAIAWMHKAGVLSIDGPWPDWPHGAPRGGIVGRARIVDVISPAPRELGPCNCAARIDVDGRWHMHTQYGFVLSEVEPLPFTPCKGMLGLWEFDESLLAKGAA